MLKSKRQRMVYFIIFIWIVFGVYGVKYGSDLSQLAIYFGSLTGFVGAYVWGETKRPSGG